MALIVGLICLVPRWRSKVFPFSRRDKYNFAMRREPMRVHRRAHVIIERPYAAAVERV